MDPWHFKFYLPVSFLTIGWNKRRNKQTGTDFLTISSSPSSPHRIFFFPYLGTNIGIFAAFTAYLSTILIWDRTTSGDSQSTLWRRDLSAKVCTNPQFFFTEEQSNSEIPALGVNEIFFVKYGLDVLGQWSGKSYVWWLRKSLWSWGWMRVTSSRYWWCASQGSEQGPLLSEELPWQQESIQNLTKRESGKNSLYFFNCLLFKTRLS